MAKRLIEMGDSLSIALLNLPQAPNHLNIDDKTILKEFVSITEPFEYATNQMSGETYVTVSLISPIIKGLYVNLIDLKDTVSKQFFSCIINSLNKRLALAETR